MEQRLDATYLRPGLIERTIGIGICATGIGTGILLAAWGISFLWRYTPPEIAVRIANPEVHIAQEAPLKVSQEKPFVVEQPSPRPVDGIGADPKTPGGDVIRREVTVFSNVRHGSGTVVTGWNYRDGSGGVPVQQFCYYTDTNFDHSSKRVDIAVNRVPLPDLEAGLVPDLEEALAKCQWWQV
jgi:hypothetical protein